MKETGVSVVQLAPGQVPDFKLEQPPRRVLGHDPIDDEDEE
jgi:hypothetical protein